MNNKSLFLIFAFVCLAFCFSCKKQEETQLIMLKNQPLDIIKASIKGHWNLYRSTGGMVPQTFYYQNSFVDFGDNDKIYWKDNTGTLLNGTITWKRLKDIMGDSTYLMSIIDINGDYSPYKGVYGIRGNSLLLYDNAVDAFQYELTR